jgi:hypothetical protein
VALFKYVSFPTLDDTRAGEACLLRFDPSRLYFDNDFPLIQARIMEK